MTALAGASVFGLFIAVETFGSKQDSTGNMTDEQREARAARIAAAVDAERAIARAAREAAVAREAATIGANAPAQRREMAPERPGHTTLRDQGEMLYRDQTSYPTHGSSRGGAPSHLH
jgi:hypothetical protein